MSILITKPNLHRLPLIFFKSLIRCSAVTLSKICFTGLNFVIICHGETLAFSADSFFSPHRNKHLRISDLHFYIWKWFFRFLHQLPFWLLTKSLPLYHVTFAITSFSFFVCPMPERRAIRFLCFITPLSAVCCFSALGYVIMWWKVGEAAHPSEYVCSHPPPVYAYVYWIYNNYFCLCIIYWWLVSYR